MLSDSTGPTPRFDHCCFKIPISPNSDTYDKILIMGGRDLSQMWQDSHMLDLSTMAWENDTQPPCLPYELCNNVCNDIESVPYHKVFSFGGKKGMMQYLNQVEVMDCGSLIWSTPPVDHGVAPEGREDCAWTFDIKTCSLLIFGGWANRWLGDLVKLNVSPIIGPPYACTGIEPESGPVFGSTEIILKGLRFKEGKIQVKFGTNEKNEVLVDAELVDSETIKVKTPNYESYGALPVEVRVSISGEGWTVNKIRYTYFANTSARSCIAYGPGLLEKGVSGIDMPFLIQAIDTQNEKAQAGGDTFTVRVVSADGKYQGISRVADLHNGMYEANYSVPMPGKYAVHVTFTELSTNEQVPIRGSPFMVECEDPWTPHRVMGATPARRKGLSICSVGNELVLYGGDKSGVSTCNTEGVDWKWSTVAPAGEAPPDRSMHSCTVLDDEVVIFGGVSLADGNELSDMYYLRKTADGWSWSHPAESKPYVRHPAPIKGEASATEEAPAAPPAEEGAAEGAEGKPAEGEEGAAEGEEGAEKAAPNQPAAMAAEPIKARNSHAAVAVDRDLYVFGGENTGDLLVEFAMCDTGDRDVAGWMEPILKGEVPAARKAAAAAATGNKIFMFGGLMPNSEEQIVATDQLVVFEISGPNELKSEIWPSVAIGGTSPVSRSYATMCEYSAGKLFLYGGMDAAGKPLHDGWFLNTVDMSWEMVFNGHSDLVLPTGSIATLVGNRLVMLNSAAGSPKLDQASSLDFLSVRDSFLFNNKMKQEAVAMLEALEAWSDKQAHGLELARNLEKLSQSFDNLLKVMDALLQVRVCDERGLITGSVCWISVCSTSSSLYRLSLTLSAPSLTFRSR